MNSTPPNSEQNLEILLNEIISERFSEEKLNQEIQSFSDEDLKRFTSLLNEFKISQKDIPNFIEKSITKAAIPEDRAIISQSLINNIKNLEKIPYNNEIRSFINNYNSSSDPLYDIVILALEDLWVNKYQKEEAYRRFGIFQNFEKILFKDPRYRDHFIHQFQVFLAGIPIIEKYYDNIESVYSEKFSNNSEINIALSWLLAATFHDVGYLVQKFETGLKTFFQEFL